MTKCRCKARWDDIRRRMNVQTDVVLGGRNGAKLTDTSARTHTHTHTYVISYAGRNRIERQMYLSKYRYIHVQLDR